MKAHQTGTLALWLLMVLKDWDQPVSVGCGVDLALGRARAVVLNCVEVHVDEGDAGEHHHHDGDEHPVLDACGREHALVAFVGTFRTGLKPFLHDDRHEGRCEYPLDTSTAQMPLLTIRTQRSGSTPGSRL